eukprot:TRINITY_DN32690_c0_g1_i1.p1 TRINITY_DN32690_c0_g1~~TRINITY_DN32690_c0_g1_i1.p1  ORF type:complete len:350 (-),score=40.52 TRINITY_DN32690_c0_g1_i1:176-1225(-)
MCIRDRYGGCTVTAMTAMTEDGSDEDNPIAADESQQSPSPTKNIDGTAPRPHLSKDSPGQHCSVYQQDCWIWYTIAMLVFAVVGLIALAIIYRRATVFVVIVATVPTLVAFGIVDYCKQSTVTWSLLLELFWMGFLGAMPIAFVEVATSWLIIDNWKGADTHQAGLLVIAATLNAFIVASFLEESFKYLCISRIENTEYETWWVRHPNTPRGTLYCGLSAALGFATIENILYVWADLSIQVAIVRAVLAVPGHCAGGVLISIGICEREYYGKHTNFWWILLPSWLFHGFYDWFLMASVVGYEDGKQTGDTLSLVGLVCAVLVDLVQFYYLCFRLKGLDQISYSRVTHTD